ncbi:MULTISPECIES: hypothetical protein [unclassified Novosphingobium]|uniref:hypothetical protein n=1 Tax=unclassified Novosphingobium TaxID=2644732 RepID=UPI00146F30D7|nr:MULTISPECIES: hypothetical protein [unclassified Novosphingobium]NMN07528.1 hypothetical protein [Novosphingobium sp. SG919]NMN89869.1 hypothetical protein [Novosphingobium sp. SG916]
MEANKPSLRLRMLYGVRELFDVPYIYFTSIVIIWCVYAIPGTIASNITSSELSQSCAAMQRSADPSERSKEAAVVLARTRATQIGAFNEATRKCIDAAARQSVGQ